MKQIIVSVLIIIGLTLCVLMCIQESKRRKLNIIMAFLICIFCTPLIAYFIFESLPLRNPRGCIQCNNEYNEAEFCGICGKNDAGELRAGFKA
jgi:presenilin-like A22 family membrane protease